MLVVVAVWIALDLLLVVWLLRCARPRAPRAPVTSRAAHPRSCDVPQRGRRAIARRP